MALLKECDGSIERKQRFSIERMRWLYQKKATPTALWKERDTYSSIERKPGLQLYKRWLNQRKWQLSFQKWWLCPEASKSTLYKKESDGTLCQKAFCQKASKGMMLCPKASDGMLCPQACDGTLYPKVSNQMVYPKVSTKESDRGTEEASNQTNERSVQNQVTVQTNKFSVQKRPSVQTNKRSVQNRVMEC